MTLNQHEKDTIARLRYEAKQHRAKAREMRRLAKEARERYDWLRNFRLTSWASERTMIAKACEREIRAIREPYQQEATR